jgi:CheY-like chemotaxis protein
MSTAAVANLGGKKSVLLVDVNMHTRESRAASMRKLGATVDCASNASTALQQFGAGLYRLVLIDLGHDKDGAEQLARDIRRKQPKQLVGFMVKGPALISTTLGPARISSNSQPSAEHVSTATDSDFGRAVRSAEKLQKSAIEI